MTAYLLVAISGLIFAALLTWALRRYGWKPLGNPTLDEELVRLDVELDDLELMRRQLERIRSLPSMNWDPERLSS